MNWVCVYIQMTEAAVVVYSYIYAHTPGRTCIIIPDNEGFVLLATMSH